MKKVKNGDQVKVHYTGKTEDDSIFATSKDKSPVEFQIGGGKVLTGLENGVIGMRVGEKKTFTIPPEEGFGKRRRELIMKVNKRQFPEDISPKIGDKIQLEHPDGSLTDARITKLEDEMVILDANHPLAGHSLRFDVEVIDIKSSI